MTYLKNRKNKRRDILSILKKIGYKKIVIYSIAILFLIIFVYYLTSFFFVSSFDICLEKLKKSYNNEVICREECYLNRKEYYSCLSKKIEKNLVKIEKIIKDEDESITFRSDLIDFLSSLYGRENVPIFLNEYLLTEGGSEEIKGKIIYSYDFSNGLDSYFQILEGDYPLKIKKAVVYKISNYSNSDEYCLDHILKIQELIFNNSFDEKLRPDLVLLLASYRDLFRDEIDSILEEVINFKFDNDNISRAFAADILDRESIEVDELEWQEYFSN